MDDLLAFCSDNRLRVIFDPSALSLWTVTNIDPIGLIDIGRVVGIGDTLDVAVAAYSGVLTGERDEKAAMLEAAPLPGGLKATLPVSEVRG